MGRPKALLDWHGRTAVEHAVAVVREGVGGGPVCVVRAPGQELPPLDAIVVDDPVAYGGPLAALHAGLVALAGEVEVAFACGVDTPLLVPAFVRAVVRRAARRRRRRRAGDRRPRSAAARRLPGRLAPRLRALLDDGAFGLRDIPRRARCARGRERELLADAELADADPQLRSARTRTRRRSGPRSRPVPTASRTSG